MMARFYYKLDPLSPIKKKNKNKKTLLEVGPPLTKFSGTAHGKCLLTPMPAYTARQELFILVRHGAN